MALYTVGGSRFFITVSLNTPMDQVGAGSWDRMVYCGALDDYFGRSVGALPYRSVRFDHRGVDAEDGLPVGTVNYPNDFDFTRITDFRHLTGEHGPTTAKVTEYPMAYEAGVNDPYYPILTEASRALAGVAPNHASRTVVASMRPWRGSETRRQYGKSSRYSLLASLKWPTSTTSWLSSPSSAATPRCTALTQRALS